MKKFVLVGLIVGLMSILLAACSSAAAPAVDTEPEADTEVTENTASSDAETSEKVFYRLSTLAPGSSPNLVMSTFATIVNESLPNIEIQVNATGAATLHALEAANGDLEFFMSSATVHNLMTAGTAMYQDISEAPELSQNLRSVFNFPLGPYHIVVDADSGIETLEDLEGKRVFLGPPGGGALQTMTQLVNGVTGMEPDTDFEAVELGWDAAAQAFQDKQIDVWITPTLPPSPTVSQVALTRQIRLLGLNEEQLQSEAVQDMLAAPGRSLFEIPADAYGENQVNTESIPTLNSVVGIGTHQGVDEEVVYTITKAFWEGAAERSGTTPWLDEISLDTAFDALIIPLHPGAIRYYQEIGLEVPEELIPAE